MATKKAAATVETEYNPNQSFVEQEAAINDWGTGGEQPEVPAIRNIEQEILTEGQEEVDLSEPPVTSLLELKLDAQTKALIEMAKSLGVIVQNQERVRQKGILEIDPVTPWNPEGKRNRVALTRMTYQHGQLVNPFQMTEEEIVLANQLKPGRYYDRKIEVHRTEDGGINLTYHLGKVHERMELARQFPDFASLCRFLIKERAEKEEKKRRMTIEDDDYLV